MISRWIVYISTVKRGSTNGLTGFLISVDWLGKKIIKKVPIPFTTNHQHWNARGGNRGGRGIAFDENNNILFVATATEIIKYNMDMQCLGTLNHEYMAGIHDILLDHDGIWITSTVHDLVFKIDFNGKLLNEWWGSKSTQFQKIFLFNKRELNIKLNFSKENFGEEYDKYCSEELFHINAIFNHEGAIYVLSNLRKSVLQVKPDEKIIITDRTLVSPHNTCLTPNRKVLINDTGNQGINIYDLLTGEKEKTINTNITRINHSSSQFAKPGWQRGLTCLEKDRYLVGSSPVQLFEVNISTGQIIDKLILDNDVGHCVHGLKAVQV